MHQKVLLSCLAALSLGACAYGNQRFVGDPAAMQADAEAVKRSERAERAEYRQERREEMMNRADAIKRATSNSSQRVYIVH